MIDPENLFDVGNTLFQGHPDEPHRRSAISRYYYGCHLMAAKAFGQLGVNRGTSTHQAVISLLAERGEKKLASDLEDLCRQRNLCDYKLNVTFTSKKAKQLKNKAEETKKKIEQL